MALEAEQLLDVETYVTNREDAAVVGLRQPLDSLIAPISDRPSTYQEAVIRHGLGFGRNPRESHDRMWMVAPFPTGYGYDDAYGMSNERNIIAETDPRAGSMPVRSQYRGKNLARYRRRLDDGQALKIYCQRECDDDAV